MSHLCLGPQPTECAFYDQSWPGFKPFEWSAILCVPSSSIWTDGLSQFYLWERQKDWGAGEGENREEGKLERCFYKLEMGRGKHLTLVIGVNFQRLRKFDNHCSSSNCVIT